MKIQSLTICGFKCFSEKTIIELDNMNCFIGTNGTGKTTALEALAKFFSVSNSHRNISFRDFSVHENGDNNAIEEKELFIEVKIIFPDADSNGIPFYFNEMIVNNCGDPPYCRIRLDAYWVKNNTPEGSVDQEQNWIFTTNEKIEPSEKKKFSAQDRSHIQVHYIPATRNATTLLKTTAGSVMRTFMHAIQWDAKFEEEIDGFSSNIAKLIDDESSIKIIQNELTHYWAKFIDIPKYSNISISPISQNFAALLDNFEIHFSPSNFDKFDTAEHLSDGTKSLFYLSLISTLFSLTRKAQKAELSGFDTDKIAQPLLTIFALEEPENHLAPHYIGKIVSVFNEIVGSGLAQVFLSSHSTSIIKRIDPRHIRYFLSNTNYETSVKTITLPKKDTEEFKFIKNAVKAYPELYFSKLVVLGEGDSEELILPKIASAYNIDIDSTFISFVPLAGRFVSHFWKLLTNLGIPFVTLLDFDEKKQTGGEDKLKYITNELMEIGKLKKDNDVYTSASGDIIDITNYVDFEKLDVFFSYPLDLDFSMLQAFFKNYTSKEFYPVGPRTTTNNKNDKNYEVICSALEKNNNPSNPDIDTFYAWYRYLFLGRGKPVSHLIGISSVTKEQIKDFLPKELERLFDRIKTLLPL